MKIGGLYMIKKVLFLLISILISSTIFAISEFTVTPVGNNTAAVTIIMEQKSQISELNSKISLLESEIEKLNLELNSLKGEKMAPGFDFLYVNIGLIVIILFLVAFFLIKKAPKKKAEINIDRVNQLKNYVSFNLSKGHKPAHLRHALLKHGHKKEEVDLAFV